MTLSVLSNSDIQFDSHNSQFTFMIQPDTKICLKNIDIDIVCVHAKTEIVIFCNVTFKIKYIVSSVLEG